MRILDFGDVAPVRSQSCWHALARCVRPGDPPTLSFVRPVAPYVCLGYHRRAEEVDLAWCAAQGLPVLRRMVGGGPVYLDADQWFFQITLPARELIGRRDRVLSGLLAPAVAALRSLGIDARLDEHCEISVGEAKVCGHGAGQIGDGVAVVGNLITGFDHARATRVLSLPREQRPIIENLMRRHVSSTAVDPGEWKDAMIASYAHHFDADPARSSPSAAETAEAERLDAVLGSPEFVHAADRTLPAARTVKIRGGVHVEVAA